MPDSNPRKVARTTNRKRTNASCDLCKGRKTKCVDPVPGPCKYCASISAPCTISVRRKQRPFYLVSEEEYRYGIEILQKFFPDTDLNLNTLRGLAQKVDRLPASPGPSTQATGPSVVQPPSECADDESAQAFDSYHDSVQTNLQYANVEEIQPPSNKRDIPPDDNSGPPAQPTTKDKGFMVMDPTGTTRYVGPRSDLLFISAVRSRAKGESQRSETEPLHIPPGLSPPSDIRCALKKNYSSHLAYLPPRQEWDSHIERYFREINTTYWLISMETLWSRLDNTYSISDTSHLSASWICFLYALMALTSQCSQPNNASPDSGNLNVDPSGQNLGPLTSSDYISLARFLVNAVMEEADMDSIRALSAMSIYLLNNGLAVPAYLYIGIAVRIAYTIGLHQTRPYTEMSTMQREAALRLAWTLYNLDCEVSRPSGRPSNINGSNWCPIPTSPMTVITGMYDPWGLFNHFVGFNIVDHRIYENFINVLSSGDRQATLQEMNSGVEALGAWYDCLPSHLRLDATIAPPHKRSICLLHLRYWNTIISMTRQALLADVQGMGQFGAESQPTLSALGQLCLNASERSLQTLELMHSSSVFSSLHVVDTKHILDVAMVSLLILTRWQSTTVLQRLNQCIELLESMENIGFSRYARIDLNSIVQSYNNRFCGGGGGGSDNVADRSDESELQTHLEHFGMDFLWNQENWTATGPMDWILSDMNLDHV